MEHEITDKTHLPIGTMDASLRCLRGVEMSMKSSATYKISYHIIYSVPKIQVFPYAKNF